MADPESLALLFLALCRSLGKANGCGEWRGRQVCSGVQSRLVVPFLPAPIVPDTAQPPLDFSFLVGDMLPTRLRPPPPPPSLASRLACRCSSDPLASRTSGVQVRHRCLAPALIIQDTAVIPATAASGPAAETISTPTPAASSTLSAAAASDQNPAPKARARRRASSRSVAATMPTSPDYDDNDNDNGEDEHNEHCESCGKGGKLLCCDGPGCADQRLRASCACHGEWRAGGQVSASVPHPMCGSQVCAALDM